MSWPECTSCRTLLEQVDDLRARVSWLEQELAVERSRRTLGGTPPGYHVPGGWRPGTLPGGVHEDYRGRV